MKEAERMKNLPSSSVVQRDRVVINSDKRIPKRKSSIQWIETEEDIDSGGNDQPPKKVKMEQEKKKVVSSDEKKKKTPKSTQKGRKPKKVQLTYGNVSGESPAENPNLAIVQDPTNDNEEDDERIDDNGDESQFELSESKVIKPKKTHRKSTATENKGNVIARTKKNAVHLPSGSDDHGSEVTNSSNEDEDVNLEGPLAKRKKDSQSNSVVLSRRVENRANDSSNGNDEAGDQANVNGGEMQLFDRPPAVQKSKKKKVNNSVPLNVEVDLDCSASPPLAKRLRKRNI